MHSSYIRKAKLTLIKNILCIFFILFTKDELNIVKTITVSYIQAVFIIFQKLV